MLCSWTRPDWENSQERSPPAGRQEYRGAEARTCRVDLQALLGFFFPQLQSSLWLLWLPHFKDDRNVECLAQGRKASQYWTLVPPLRVFVSAPRMPQIPHLRGNWDRQSPKAVGGGRQRLFNGLSGDPGTPARGVGRDRAWRASTRDRGVRFRCRGSWHLQGQRRESRPRLICSLMQQGQHWASRRGPKCRVEDGGCPQGSTLQSMAHQLGRKTLSKPPPPTRRAWACGGTTECHCRGAWAGLVNYLPLLHS